MSAALSAPDAEHLFNEVLRAHRRPANPSPSRWLQALENALEEQISDYGRLLLPGLGLGERVVLDERYYRLSNKIWRQPPGELWHFDRRYPQSWIHAALLYPFEMLDDWLVLVPRDALTEQQARAISPPLIPRVGQALSNLPWIVADFGGHGGGRLRREEFLTLLGDLPWIRIEHYAELQVIQIQRWQGNQLKDRWRASIADTFGCALPEIDPHTQQSQSCALAMHSLPRNLPVEPHKAPLQVAALLDILGDPYAALRRFTKHQFGIDTEQLGPLLLWRDFPDELFEFDDVQDTSAADISFVMADTLSMHHQEVRSVLHAWFEAVENIPFIELPVIGTLHTIMVPELSACGEEMSPSPVSTKGASSKLRSHVIPSGYTLVASTLPPDYWLCEIAEK